MAKRDRLTPAEWEIMETVWELGGAPSVRDVLECAYPSGEKAYTTVQTVMNTLERKGLLRRSKIGLVNFYEPTRTKEEAARAEMAGVATRVFGGSIPAMASALLSLEGVDRHEIERLRELLDQKASELEEEDGS
jgi:predicted transcriptional regulator